jgi:integral membrane protein (TIGR01906 family)
VCAALALASTSVGLALIPLQTAPVTELLVARYAEAGRAGIGQERMLEVAETVRTYVVAGRGSLPAWVDGRPGLEADAVAHLDDVRVVLSGARSATVASAVLAALLIVPHWMRRGAAAVAPMFAAGAAVTAALPLLAGLAAVFDFSSFFAGFHALFFAPGTWTFPSDSLLIRMFPEPFWIAMAIAWGLFVAAVAAAQVACALALGRAGRRAGPVHVGVSRS